MPPVLTPHQRAVLEAARAYLDGKLTRQAFLALVQEADYQDPRLKRVIPRVAKLPSPSNLFGVGEKEYEKEVAKLREIIHTAETAVY